MLLVNIHLQWKSFYTLSELLVGITVESGETGKSVHYFISHYFIKTLHNFTEETPIQINIYNIIIYIYNILYIYYYIIYIEYFHTKTRSQTCGGENGMVTLGSVLMK